MKTTRQRFNKPKGRFNKTKGRFNKTKGKNRKNNTKKIKKVLQKAGKILGEGSYGEVYGDPRIKCSDENDDDAENKDYYATVSKVFEEIETRDHEFAAAKFEDILGEEYFVFPMKKCNTTTDKLKKDDDFVKKHGKTGDKEWTYMITYPKAYSDLHYEFKHLSNYTGDYNSILEWLANALPNINRIGEGIQLLQYNNFIHGDIKLSNCLFMLDGKYKIGDIDTIANINNINDDWFPKFPQPRGFGYHIWPLISIFCQMSDFKNIDNPKIVGYYEYKINEEFNKNGLELLHYLNAKIIVSVREIFSNDSDNINKNTIIDTITSIHYDKIITEPNVYFAPWVEYFKSVENPILDLYKRIDVYSFGIFLLEFVYNFLKNKKVISDISNDDKTIKLIVEITKIIEKCCVLTDLNGNPKPPVNFNIDILNEYKTVINAYISGLELDKNRSILGSNGLGPPTSRRSRSVTPSSDAQSVDRLPPSSDAQSLDRLPPSSDAQSLDRLSQSSDSSGPPTLDSTFDPTPKSLGPTQRNN
jgi:serine/threonine protein kinase